MIDMKKLIITKDKKQIFNETKERFNPYQTGHGYQKIKKYDKKQEINDYKKGKYE